MENHAESELKESTDKLLRDLRQVVQDGEGNCFAPARVNWVKKAPPRA